MNVFVTGGAGYIGSVCVEDLCNAGHSVTVMDNLCEGHRAAVDPRARFVLADLADREATTTALRECRPEAIIHFAAHALVGESMTNPSKYFRNNVTAGLNLLDAAIELGVKKIVVSSTCATYGPPERVPIDETLPQRPINPYGESKLMFEHILRWYREIHGLDFVAFRYFNAAGASERFGEAHRVETHLIPNILRVALKQKENVEVFGTDYPTPDGSCVRDYVHVSDLSQAHILALAPRASGCFNLGIGEGFSVKEMIRVCEKVSGKSIPTVERPRRPGDPPTLIAAAEKASSQLGWKPRFRSAEAIVQTAWDWHQRHPNGYGD